MIADLTLNVNQFIFTVSDDMYIDLRPEDTMFPIAAQMEHCAAAIYTASLGKESRRTMYAALVLVAGLLSRGQCTPLDLPWPRIGRGHVIAMRSWLIEHRAPATGRRVMAALKGALKEAWRLGQLSADEYARTVDVPPIKGQAQEQAAGRALSHGEKMAILATLATHAPAQIRNTAIFGLAVYGGLRRAEIAALQVGDYDPASKALRIHGKGSKQRTIYAAPGVDDALADWLIIRAGTTGQALFTRILRGGHLQPAGLTPAAIYTIMQQLQRDAGVRRFSPHDLRRTFAGDLLDEGADLATVQRLMGHSDPGTTSKYDRRGERSKKSAMDRLHMPYQRKFEDTHV